MSGPPRECGSVVAGLRMATALLAPAERRQLALLVPLVMLGAALETAGVASVVPLLSLLADPSALERNRVLAWAFRALGFVSPEKFFFAAGLGVLILMSVSNAVTAASLWGQLRFAWGHNHRLSARLLARYLEQPYEFFLDRNSTALGANILSEAQTVAAGVVLHGIQLCARAASVALISGVLLVVDPRLALGVFIAFGGVYGALYYLVRRRVTRSGAARVAANKERYRVASEALAGIKEIKLYGLEDEVTRVFSRPSESYSRSQADHALVGSMPRFAFEVIAFGGVLLMVLYLLGRGSALGAVLPLIGLFVFAAYRLLPAVQTVFVGITSLRFNLASLSVLHADLVAGGLPPPPDVRAAVVPFGDRVELDAASFAYSAGGAPVVRELSLRVAAGEWLALVGPTGSGKSTAADLLLGLLAPTAGTVRIDGRELRDASQRKGWQRQVGYVPQTIFLLDDTVARNIAFGVPAGEVDQARLEWAGRVAQIDDFVSRELAAGYATSVGERGVRLSGGQRQRIGVARALYRKPAFLVLDEATSALDEETEERFFAALRTEMPRTAVLSITHRLASTRHFDRVLVLEGGRVVEQDGAPQARGRGAGRGSAAAGSAASGRGDAR
jgi:ATP-binding cassette subfamily C protein